MSHAPSVEDTADPSRRGALCALLILVAITVVLAAATAVYLFTRPTPYSGNWVGPGNFQGSGDPYAIEMYLSLEQKPFSVSGTGEICAFTSSTDGANIFMNTYVLPVTVEGSVSGESVNLALYPDEGDHPTVFTRVLHVQGALNQGQLTLNSTTQQHLLLTMQHGSMSAFTAACDQLIQPAPEG